MFCRHCGKKLPDDSRFCTFCGKSVAVSDETLGDEPEKAPASVDDAAGEVSAESLDPDAGQPGDAVQVDGPSAAEGDAQDATAAEGAPSSLFSDNTCEEVGDAVAPDDSADSAPPEDPVSSDESTGGNADAQAPDAFTYEKGEGDQPDEPAHGFSGFSIPDSKRRPLIIGACVALALVVARTNVKTRAYGGDHPALVLDELGQGLQSVQRDGTRLDVDLVEPQLHIIHDTLN